MQTTRDAKGNKKFSVTVTEVRKLQAALLIIKDIAFMHPDGKVAGIAQAAADANEGLLAAIVGNAKEEG